jgi:alpha-tubulin suppressor-like RCC1 family protein
MVALALDTDLTSQQRDFLVTASQSATTLLAVATGASFSCALLADNTVVCWGSNANGELGNGGTGDSSIPSFVMER